MADFLAFLKVIVICGTVLFVVMLVLLSLPQSKLRCMALEMAKYVLAVGLFILIPLPIDVVPDVLPPFTYADDVAYLLAGIAALRGARAEGRKRRLYEDIEVQQLHAKREEGRHD